MASCACGARHSASNRLQDRQVRGLCQLAYRVNFLLNATPTNELYTLSLHDALPISSCPRALPPRAPRRRRGPRGHQARSEEHTSELQSPMYLVCRLLLEKKKTKYVSPIRNCRSISSFKCGLDQ